MSLVKVTKFQYKQFRRKSDQQAFYHEGSFTFLGDTKVQRQHSSSTTVLKVAGDIQDLSKRFERFKFGIFYVLIAKIRYNFTRK